MSQMSSFFSQAASLGQQLGQSFGQSIQHATAAAAAPDELLRVGSHTVVVKRRLAEGGFGVVDLVVEQFTQKELVLKRSNIDREEMFATVRKEILMLQKFAGPLVVRLLDNDISHKGASREALLLMEHYGGGNLQERLRMRNGELLPTEAIFKIFGQILSALRPFHEARPPIINRDLKLENVLFGPDGKVRLCDFGSCMESPILVRNVSEREKVEELIQKETTPMYRAPEMADLYMRDRLTEKTDVWALGCIFYALAFLRHPFQDVGSLGIIAAKYTLPPQSPLDEGGHELLRRMLDIDPEARPSISELLPMVIELAAGRPLPPHQLSAEAQQRRHERMLADQVRESKKKKAPAPVVPARKGLPPSANSVAAKRLAAKRGQSAGMGCPADDPSTNLFDGAEAFDPFAQPDAQAHHAQAHHAHGPGPDPAPLLRELSFDPFAHAPPAAVAAAETFNPFDEPEPAHTHVHAKSSVAAALFEDVDEPAPASQASLRRPSFDPFDSTPAPAPAPAAKCFDGFDAFAGDEGDDDPFSPPIHGNADAFGIAPVLDFEESPITSSPRGSLAAPAPRSSFATEAVFDPFAAAPVVTPTLPRPAVAKAPSQRTLLDDLTAPPPQATVPAPLLDIFSTDLLTPAAPAAPALVPTAPSVSRPLGGGLGHDLGLLSLCEPVPRPRPVMLSQPSLGMPFPQGGLQGMGAPPMGGGMARGMGVGAPRPVMSGPPIGGPMPMGGMPRGLAGPGPRIVGAPHPPAYGHWPGQTPAAGSADPFASINTLGKM